jgi:hypothetical protein
VLLHRCIVDRPNVHDARLQPRVSAWRLLRSSRRLQLLLGLVRSRLLDPSVFVRLSARWPLLCAEHLHLLQFVALERSSVCRSRLPSDLQQWRNMLCARHLHVQQRVLDRSHLRPGCLCARLPQRSDLRSRQQVLGWYVNLWG